ncbi:MAG: hypothetical protein CME06_11545 [Gemmatimonadetes bacterium]|nr:hypothetical protein [Gemmatimonadota bacterium]
MLRRKFLELCVHLALEVRGRTLAVGLALTLVALAVSTQLGLNFQWTEMLPADSPLVVGVERVHSEFTTGNSYIVAITAPDAATLEAAVDDAAREIEKIDEPLRQVVRGIDEEFALDHGLGSLGATDLRRAERLLSDPDLLPFLRHLNDTFEDDYGDSTDRLSDDERSVVSILQAVGGLTDGLIAAADGRDAAPLIDRAVRDLSSGDPYFRSLDGEMALIFVSPLGEVGDMTTVIPVDYAIEELFEGLAQRHPKATFERTGVIPVSRDELDSLGGMTYLLSGLALALAYLLLAIAFRDLTTPILAGAPLLAGIIWSLAVYTFTVRELNIMTAVIMMVLTGLGIDFSIHLVGRFQEERQGGGTSADALRRTLSETGGGVVTGGLTTAIAFFVLMVAETKGIREFGFCAGIGVLLTLCSVLTLLPALLMWRDERLSSAGRRLASRPLPALGALAHGAGRRALPFSIVVVVTTAAGIWLGTQNRYEYNMLELEPAGLRSVDLQPEIVERFGLSMEVAFVTAPDIETSRHLAEAFRDLESVGDVDDISLWLPPPDEAAQAGETIRRIRAAAARGERRFDPADEAERIALAEQVGRLRDNIIEIGDLAYLSGLDRIATSAARLTGAEELDGRLSRLAYRLESSVAGALGAEAEDVVNWERVRGLADRFGERLAARVERMTRIDRAATIDDLPGDVVERYRSAVTGEFLITLMPKGDIYEREPLVRFSEEVAQVHGEAVGTPQLILEMNEEMLREGFIAVPAAFVAIAFLLFCDFRRPLPTLLAMVPLIVATAWSLGTMKLLGVSYNFVNVIGIPILIGIGVDDGVHLLHRLRHGGGLREAGSGVGRAMLLTSLTTMAGFGSIGLYSHRGMASLGIALAIGVAACFLATMLALPPLLQFCGVIEELEAEQREAELAGR